METTKHCRGCDTLKPVEAFHRNKRSKDGLNFRCRECCSAYMKEYNAKNVHKLRAKYALDRQDPEKVKKHSEAARRHRLKLRYGMEVSDYDQLLEIQNGACAICGVEQGSEFKRAGRGTKPGIRKLNVDHDHETGKVRGLLCHNCNTAIGHAGESAARLRVMAAYVEQGGVAHGRD